MFLIKLATVMAFFIDLLVICMLVKVIADQEQRIQRLFAENVALETKAIQNTNFGNDFIVQPVHCQELPVRINLTTLDKEKTDSVADWSLEFECQTDHSTW